MPPPRPGAAPEGGIDAGADCTTAVPPRVAWQLKEGATRQKARSGTSCSVGFTNSATTGAASDPTQLTCSTGQHAHHCGSQHAALGGQGGGDEAAEGSATGLDGCGQGGTVPSVGGRCL